MLKKWHGWMTYTDSVKETGHMYEGMFGFKPVKEREGVYCFKFENGHFWIIGAPNTSVPFMNFDVSDIESEVERLKKVGVSVEMVMEVLGGKFAFCTDKYGNDFGLFQKTE